MTKFLQNVCLMFAALMLLFNISAQSQDVNLALDANVTTSFVSAWEKLSAVNDGFTPTSSKDVTKGGYGNWDSKNSFQWVQYEWPLYVIINETNLYWYDDGGGILVPTEAYLEYLKGTEWISIGEIPKTKNAWNDLKFNQVRCKTVRVRMKNTKQSTGILEWKVKGQFEIDEESPSTPLNVAVSDTTKYTLTIGWDTSTDNSEVTGYEVFLNGELNHESAKAYTTIIGLDPETEYKVSVRAVDYSKNYSIMSDTLTIATKSLNSKFSWGNYPVENVTYEFSQDYPDFAPPTKILDDCPQVVGEIEGDWFVFRWGPKRSSAVTNNAISIMVQSYDHEFGIFRKMGWPPDRRARNGYKSGIYLYGSGLCTDSAPNTELGGWQGTIFYDGSQWEMVLASFYPVRAFDPKYTGSDKQYQTEAMIHEGIHSIFAGLPGIKNAAWFHEGSNTYLQREALALQDGDYTRPLGDLTVINFIAPFMPVECYSGWLQDGSFGGPSAEGVDQGAGISSWRNITGGVQYSSAWGIFQHQRLGEKSIPWLWQNSPKRVLEGIGTGLGDANMRRLLSEYHAKQALVDMGLWSYSYLRDMKSVFKARIVPEGDKIWKSTPEWLATPYAKTTNSGGLLTPESRTTPGWSGANQIPITVDPTAEYVKVNFSPIGKNMTLSLCYRTEDGVAVYGEPVSKGTAVIKMEGKPANSVVIAVISNTDYIYEGETTRKAHFDYRVELGEGTIETADIYTMWFDYALEPPVVEPRFSKGVYTLPVLGTEEMQSLEIYPNPVHRNGVITIKSSNTDVISWLTVVSLDGVVVHQKYFTGSYDFPIDGSLSAGIYIANIEDASGKSKVFKFVVTD
jgi:hypothetical protein